jgi:hypothetical protein
MATLECLVFTVVEEITITFLIRMRLKLHNCMTTPSNLMLCSFEMSFCLIDRTFAFFDNIHIPYMISTSIYQNALNDHLKKERGKGEGRGDQFC